VLKSAIELKQPGLVRDHITNKEWNWVVSIHGIA